MKPVSVYIHALNLSIEQLGEQNIFLFVHHTKSILAKLNTRCFEHFGDISCSLLVIPSHTDESWEGRNTCLWMFRICGKYPGYIYSLKKVFEFLNKPRCNCF